MTMQIPLTQGRVALVSDHRYEHLNQRDWSLLKTKNGLYAVRYEGPSHQKMIYMHREITQAPDGVEVDHRDNNGLNNVDDNLRVCTHAQNLQNRKIACNNTSGYKGVSWHKTNKKWRAQIRSGASYLHIGYFVDRKEAARAYDTKACELYGPYARTNF